LVEPQKNTKKSFFCLKNPRKITVNFLSKLI